MSEVLEEQEPTITEAELSALREQYPSVDLIRLEFDNGTFAGCVESVQKKIGGNSDIRFCIVGRIIGNDEHSNFKEWTPPETTLERKTVANMNRKAPN